MSLRCWSFLGRTGGAQPVSMGDGCVWIETVQHELMHDLGFDHEHTCYDRDNYVIIDWTNITPGITIIKLYINTYSDRLLIADRIRGS